MIDIKFLREHPDIVKENIKKKFQDKKLVLVDEVIDLDKKSREAKLNGDNLRSERKTLSNQIGNLMKNGEKEKATELFDWVTNHADYLGFLPEQIDRNGDDTIWVRQLSWSHAMYIIVKYKLSNDIENGMKGNRNG